MSSIDSKTARAKLKPRHAPYWVKLEPGRMLGYRKSSDAEGVWYARYRAEGTDKRDQKTLGVFTGDDAYRAAKKAAEVWFLNRDAGVTHNVLTVADACQHYIKIKRARDGDTSADAEEARLTRLVLSDSIGKIELSKLIPKHFQDWRQRVVSAPARVSRSKGEAQTYRTRAPATVNRDLVPLRAALNSALEDGHLATDFAWRKHLKPNEGADVRRELYLDRLQRKALLEAADSWLRPFLMALCLLPVRPGALAALTAGDFNKRQGSIRIGQDKAGKDRRISLPAAASALFTEQSKGKTPKAPLLARPDGKAWDKDSWKRPIKTAVLTAELPQEATAYTLRHSVITDLVTEGVPLMTVAQISGTSVLMIERHYSHLQSSASKAALERLAL